MTSLDERETLGGMRAVVFAILATVFAVGIAFGLLLGRCSTTPDPVPAATHAPAVVSKAIAEATASSSVKSKGKVTIRRPAQAFQGGEQGAHAPVSGMVDPVASKTPLKTPLARSVDPVEEIVVEFEQESGASAGVVSTASASVVDNPQSFNVVNKNSSGDHGRLGVIAAYPLGLAVDFSLAEVAVPRWVVPMDLRVALDLAANFEAAGLGLAVGSKGFTTAGGFASYRLDRAGWYLGMGLRF